MSTIRDPRRHPMTQFDQQLQTAANSCERGVGIDIQRNVRLLRRRIHDSRRRLRPQGQSREQQQECNQKSSQGGTRGRS